MSATRIDKEQIQKRVSKWIGKPVIVVEDEIVQMITSAQHQLLDELMESLPNRKHTASDLNEDMNTAMMEVVEIRSKGFNSCLTKVVSAIKALKEKLK